jgi:CRP-like cAMP-binding protein
MNEMSDSNELIDLLRRKSAKKCEVRRYDRFKGAQKVEPGSLVFVSKGVCAFCAAYQDQVGNERVYVLNYLKEGDFFLFPPGIPNEHQAAPGDVSFCVSGAGGSAEILIWGQSYVSSQIKTSPELAQAVLLLTQEQAQHQAWRSTVFMGRQASYFPTFFYELLNRLGVREGGVYVLRLAQWEIGAYAGVTREQTSHFISSRRRDGALPGIVLKGRRGRKPIADAA